MPDTSDSAGHPDQNSTDGPDGPDGAGATGARPEPFSRAAIWTATVLAALLVVGVVVASRILGPGNNSADSADSADSAEPGPTRTGPLALVPVDAPDAESPECGDLIDAAPDELTSGSVTLARLPIAEPAPPAALAWSDRDGEPVVLRCGLPRPAELTRTAGLRQISRVRWLPVTGEGATTWYVVDRAVYVGLTVPDGSGTGPLQEISVILRDTLPAKPVRPGR